MITKEFIESQKQKILRKIDHLIKDINDSKVYDDIGSASEDEATEFEEFQGKSALARDLKKELVQLQEALKKIEDGSYGICEKCSNQIEEARLKAFPQSKYCASDK